MKRIVCAALCLMLALSLLCGCGTGESNQTTAPHTSAPPDTVPPTTAAVDPTVPRLEAVTILDSLFFDTPPVIVALDDFTLAATWWEWVAGVSVAHLEIIDLYGGQITASMEMKDGQTLVHKTFDGGRLVLSDYTDNTFTVYDSRLNPLNRFSAENTNGCLSDDLSRYYYLSGSVLMVMDTATGEAAPVEAAAEHRFSGLYDYSSEKKLLLAILRTSSFSYDTVAVALNPDTGEFFIASDLDSVPQFTASGICSAPYNAETNTTRLYYAQVGDACFREIPGNVFAEGADSFPSPLSGTDYILSCLYDNDGLYECALYHAGTRLSKYTLDLQDFPDGLFDVVQTPNGRLVATRGISGSYGLCILCPDQLTFSPVCELPQGTQPLVQQDFLTARARELEGMALGDQLTPQRQRADALEEKYGITILLSHQCALPLLQSDYTAFTSDIPYWDEAAQIDWSLDALDQALSLYPEDFFLQFRDPAGEQGILILPIGGFEAGVVGLHFTAQDWFCVAVDIGYHEQLGTYCHEFWHATEEKLYRQDYAVLGYDNWHALNPEGFEYFYDSSDYRRHTEWTYKDGWGEESHFVDAYSKVNEKEDRARIMEYAMTDDEFLRALPSMPALQQKYRLMCQAIRQGFDTTHWTDLYWERIPE